MPLVDEDDRRPLEVSIQLVSPASGDLIQAVTTILQEGFAFPFN